MKKFGDIFGTRKEYLNLLLRQRKGIEEAKDRSCRKCGAVISANAFERNHGICPDCGAYMSLSPRERIALLADDGSFTELWRDMASRDPIAFPGYKDKLDKARRTTGQMDSVVTGTLRLYGHSAAIAVLDAGFFMGSMGTVQGEKIARLAEHAMKHRLPLIIFTASGGARMQEGLYSLMQMTKTSAAIERFKAAGGLYISVLCHPTTGGVSASFAFLGDIILAEPRALIGFAGSRVIEQTIGESVPDEIRESEALVSYGMLDGIVERKKLKKTLGRIIAMHDARSARAAQHKLMQQNQLTEMSPTAHVDMHTDKSAYEFVALARDKDRPKITDYVEQLFEGFIELKGDRLGAEDGSIYGGIALFHGMPVTVIGHRKGKNIPENREFHFGMASPEGYRKAMRLAREAEKFGRPIITFVDTPGAYPGLDAEQHGQPAAIAESLALFSAIAVPVIAIVTGEGGSGGALALSVADEIWMLENSVYSILSPEGFAAILWKDAKRAAEASEVMRLTSREIYKTGIIDGIIPEGEDMYDELDQMLCTELGKLMKMDKKSMLSARYAKYRRVM